MTDLAACVILVSSPGAVRIPLDMLLVFGFAKLGDELLQQLHQPGIVGQILAGVLIGPNMLGWVRSDDLLRVLAELGVMFLLFKVGLEIKSSELLRVGGRATLVAALGVVLPFLLGWWVCRLWGEPPAEAVFVGAAMVATSVGITAHVLASRGLLASQTGKIVLAAAVIDDVLGLLILALVSSLARGSVNFIELGITGAIATSFVLIVATWGTRALGRLVPLVSGRLRASESQFSVAIVLMFALAVLAVYAGVAAIIGAFLAGMALAETVRRRVQDLVAGVSELLVPFFLVAIGLGLSLAAFARRGTIELALVVLAAAVVSKLAGCGLGAYGLAWRERLKIGLAMVPRGEVGLVVAQIGLTLGVVTKEAYAVVVFMAVVTTLVAPPLLKLAYPRERPVPQPSL